MTKTVPVRSHYRADGTFVRAHNRRINGASSVPSSGTTAYPRAATVAAGGGGGLLLAILGVLVLLGLSSTSTSAPSGNTSPSPTTTVHSADLGAAQAP